MPRLRSLLVLGVPALAAAAIALACGASDFDRQSKVNTVRIFGVRADKPYTRSGETVTLEALLTDGRKEKTRPLKLVWVPVVCINPREDLYYACFIPSTIDGGSRLEAPFPIDAAALPPGTGTTTGSGNVFDRIPKDIDLAQFLPQGSTFTFRMPDDVIRQRPGSPPYGLAIVFNIACAGQVRLRERVGNAPQQVPIECTDENGVKLGPDDYVLGINRVYAYADRTNTNPVVERVTLDGVDVDMDAGITVDHCVAERRMDCRKYKIDVKVTEGSWEANPQEPSATRAGASAGQREQIWATYYGDLGDFEDDARLLFDPTKGRVPESDVTLRAPGIPSEGTIWVVVHDNRAGAAFVVLPLHVK